MGYIKFMTFSTILYVACVICLVCGCRQVSVDVMGNGPAPDALQFEVIEAPNVPVIDADHPDLAGNKYGFEGGCVVREGGLYHLFVAEMAGDPFWAKMRLAHWASSDGRTRQRKSTLYETSGALDIDDNRFSLWAPMPIFNEQEDRWNLFYIAYRPHSSNTAKIIHVDGSVWRAVSKVSGRDGIAGPYEDLGIVLQPDAESQPWEGQQGTDSFYPWRVGSKWYAFYGSHYHFPGGPWLVGLAQAPDLAGPWKRCEDLNPLPIEKRFIENPICTRIGPHFVAIYDCDIGDIGFSVSADGIHWPPGQKLDFQPGNANWSSDVRTPLCLIPEGDNVYTMIYTGKHKDKKFWPVGLVKLKLITD